MLLLVPQKRLVVVCLYYYYPTITLILKPIPTSNFLSTPVSLWNPWMQKSEAFYYKVFFLLQHNHYIPVWKFTFYLLRTHYFPILCTKTIWLSISRLLPTLDQSNILQIYLIWRIRKLYLRTITIHRFFLSSKIKLIVRNLSYLTACPFHYSSSVTEQTLQSKNYALFQQTIGTFFSS